MDKKSKLIESKISGTKCSIIFKEMETENMPYLIQSYNEYLPTIFMLWD